MFNKESIPFAPALIESMRSLGYSFETAISDLIDNSISANAKNIDIIMTPGENPQLIILDDGHGMDELEIEEAMRYGSKNPLEKRKNTDLGRFGLGLKSASLSQCRKLVVVSKKNKKISAYSWDLNHIINQGSWMLIGYGEDEINNFPNIEKLHNLKNGTYLLLEDFDRIKESTSNLSETLKKNINHMISHVSLVFHRYLSDKVKIYVNGELIEAKDPFLLNNKKTQLRRERIIKVDGEQIKVKPYILPHISHLTSEDIKKIGGKENLKNEQGFYIYRNKRLIIWGTWFRLERKDELNKLARVQVDISNLLDYMWSIDIKKSSANLPDKIKKNLYNVVQESIINSEGVHTYRGRKESNGFEIDYVWERIKLRDGFEYKINKNIPQIKLLENTLDKNQIKLLDQLIEQLENNFPTNTFYIDASKGNVKKQINKETKEAYLEIKNQIDYAKNNGLDYKNILNIFIKSQPYCFDKDLINMLENLKKELGEF